MVTEAEVATPTPGWWEGMVGPGRPIDTDRWHVVCVNSLGSCKGSTGPASIDPSTGEILGYEAHYLGKAQLQRGESTVPAAAAPLRNASSAGVSAAAITTIDTSTST